MQRSKETFVVSSIIVLMLSGGSGAATIDPSVLQFPGCGENSAFFTYNKGTGKCDLRTPANGWTSGDCIKVGGKFAGTAGGDAKCESVSSVEPVCKADPALSTYSAKVVKNGSDDYSCKYERPDVPTSVPGDYVGDCFELRAKVNGLTDGGQYFVTDQDSSNKNNPKLTLVEAVDWKTPSPITRFIQRGLPGGLGCRAKLSTTTTTTTTTTTGETTITTATTTGSPSLPESIDASALVQSGAVRRGYAYGVLSVPYKYYPSSKKFTAGVPLGGYLGWRIGQPGSAATFAAAMTLGAVKADTTETKTDPSSGVSTTTITGDTNVAALSGAVGVIFDIFKNNESRPFKAGFFVGRDFVNSSPNINYEFNNKTWIAVQIGYDFTDK